MLFRSFWRESAVTIDALEKWMVKEADKIESHTSRMTIDGDFSANEFTFVLKDGKRLLRRVVADGGLLA